MRLTLKEAEGFPAKTVEREDGASVLGISVLQHGLIAGEVLRGLLAMLRFPLKETILPEAIIGLAGVHDIGKVNPLFLRKLLRAMGPDAPEPWTALSDAAPGLEEVWHPEAGCSVLLRMKARKEAAYVVARHHGRPVPFRCEPADSPALGGVEWEEVRERLVREILDALHLAGFPLPLRARKETVKLQNDVWTGLVVVADWIASRQEAPVPAGEEAKTAERLLREAGFSAPVLKDGFDFASVFGFRPRDEQAAFMSLYRGPGVYVLEAPTGCGKTEAALGLAFEAIARGDAGGIYFGLPTRLTSNAIHERVERALGAFLVSTPGGVQLIHSGARLHRMRLGKEAMPGGAWFSNSRQAILAPFGVGTVDQALMGLLSGRFATLRAAGLVGKVIILDEIHSYDAYTSTLLKRLVRRIETLGGTVVILSATLTAKFRNALLGLEKQVEADDPVIFTARAAGEVTCRGLPARPESRKLVRVRLVEGDGAEDQAFRAAVERVRAGQQVIWIENTVDAAQGVRDRFLAEGIAECGLLHSRFRGMDREAVERSWIRVFGKSGDDSRRQCGHVLVGTQILEQSLDLDADFMVTRLAPMDLLIQRIGRLWRHENRSRPAGCNEPELTIIAAPEAGFSAVPGQDLRNLFGKSGRVYAPPYVLYRTLETLKTRLARGDVLELPMEVRSLLEETYAEVGEKPGSEALQLLEETRERKALLEDCARGAISYGGGEPDEKAEEASTRYIEYESSPVLLVETEELRNAPTDPVQMALWLEERVVRTQHPPVAPALSESLEAPSALRRFAARSAEYSSMPAFLFGDGPLTNVSHEPLKDGGWTYSKDRGLSRSGAKVH